MYYGVTSRAIGIQSNKVEVIGDRCLASVLINAAVSTSKNSYALHHGAQLIRFVGW
jgi:hypothetical protein